MTEPGIESSADAEAPLRRRSSHGLAGHGRAGRGLVGSALRFLLLYGVSIALLCALGWCIWVYVQIEHYAYEDEAAPADVICVFGAAEYGGHPSKVFQVRLEHALTLY